MLKEEHKNKQEKVDTDITKYWKMSNKELYDHFDQTEEGFSDNQVKLLINKYGPNELKEEEGETIFEKIYEQFEDPLVRILLGAAVISFIIALTGGQHEGLAAYVEPFVILLILIANATIGVYQDLNADKAVEALKKLQTSKSHVKRNGVLTNIEAADLVPGDLVMLSEGEKAPADVRLIEIFTSNFEMSQESFTGENLPNSKNSDPIEIDEKPTLKDLRNYCFSSCGVAVGSGLGIVIKTGMDSELGQIVDDIREKEKNKEKSPLAKKLDEFADYLTYIIGAICVVVWVINFKNFYDESHGSFINGMIYYFKISVALAVAAIPEGLPAVITTCFALGSRRMSANNAIVRKLDSIETLGCTTVICSDKTGTLTTNNMSVTKILVLENENNLQTVIREVEGTTFSPVGIVKEFDSTFYQNSHNIKLLAITGSICNMSSITDTNGVIGVTGSPTEGALKVFTEKLRIYDTNYKNTNDIMGYNKFITDKYETIFTLEFDRTRKAMSVLAKEKSSNKLVLFTKGAPEILVNQCNNYYTRDGKLAKLNDTQRTNIIDTITQQFASHALRTLVLCIKEDLPSLKNIDITDKKSIKAYFKERANVLDIEKGITFLGVVGMLDPPRPEVNKALEICKEAGLRVIMITGDNKDTADAIASKVGIIEQGVEMNTVSFITSEFFKFPHSKQQEILKNKENLVFSRSEPKHKSLLVELLKEQKQIVAMTGDGVNDAIALAAAHIGVSMGINGTEVAKEASAIILADDNFATIVKAIEEGRSIYMNMKAFIRYLISSNIGEVVSIFLTSIFGIPEAFTSIQLLWVNLVTDGPPATALGFNPPEENIMKKPPRSGDDPLLTKWVITRYFIIGTYVGIATIGIFVYWYLYFEHSDGHTLITWAQLTDWANCEKWVGFTANSFSGIDLSKNACDYFTYGKKKAMTLSLTVLVIIEMFNACNAISDEASLVSMPPWRNQWLILAISSSVILHFVILYVPFCNDIFGILPLDLKEWIMVIIFSFPVILIDELIKLYVRLTFPKNARHHHEKKNE